MVRERCGPSCNASRPPPSKVFFFSCFLESESGQQLSRAECVVDGETVSQIGRGLLCLIGLTASDTEKDMDYLVNKITKLRFWPGTKTSAV